MEYSQVIAKDGVKYIFVFEIQQSSYLYLFLLIAKVTYLYLLLVFDVFYSNSARAAPPALMPGRDST